MRKVTNSRPLTEAEMAELAALPEVPDTGDIPEAAEENWAAARRGVFYRRLEGTISLHVDPDVLHWLRGQGPGYQTIINRILRERMDAEAAGQR